MEDSNGDYISFRIPVPTAYEKVFTHFYFAKNETKETITKMSYSAKEYNRYERFIKAIALIQNIAYTNSKIDWFEIVAECAYYDQSQLINDFKHYINLSPTKYLKFHQDICNSKS